MTDPTFAQLSAKLAAMQNIASAKQMAFNSRLKNLIRLGLVDREAPGRGAGKTWTFSPDDVTRMVVAVEMTDAGITPDLVVQTINAQFETIWEAFMAEHRTGVFLTFQFRALASLTNDPTGCIVECVLGGENIKLNRAVVLNVSAMRRAFRETAADKR